MKLGPMRQGWHLAALAPFVLLLVACQPPENAFPGVSAQEGKTQGSPARSQPAADATGTGELRILFDGSHGQTAGAADWIVDADSSELVFKTFTCRPGPRQHSAQRFPTPPQEEVTATTRETFWDGGLSAWGIALAQDALEPGRPRWRIEQYAWDAAEMTWGDRANPQDLSHYAVLVLAEPNTPFTEGEIEAIHRFVREGGGLFLIADHETSDRDCSEGGERLDSPAILNRLMGTKIRTRPTSPYWDPDDPANDFGVFGIWFNENGNDSKNDRDNRRFDWFDEPVNRNVSQDTADPIVRGPWGDGRGGLGLFGATQLAISTDSRQGNPAARAHVWRNGQNRSPRASGVSERVTFASAEYGKGRVVAIGDSSPADDGTGQGKLYPGWDKAKGGVANDQIFLNATAWLAKVTPIGRD
jgi:hypothetical protein